MLAQDPPSETCSEAAEALGCVQGWREEVSWYSSTAKEPQSFIFPKLLSLSPRTLLQSPCVAARTHCSCRLLTMLLWGSTVSTGRDRPEALL